MKILAIEFSSRQRSAAVIDAAGSHTRLTLGEAIDTAPRSTQALALIESALREAQLEREQVECLVVGLGPGSYTGIRAAIALAQGWQLARAVRLLGISSAECLATEAYTQGLRGRVHVVIDAQRGEFYLAGYELRETAARETEPLRLASREDVKRAQAYGVLVGPDMATWSPDARVLYPHASTLGALALTRTDFLAGEKLEPIYLRPTQFIKAPPSRVIPPL
jgi:tRNA threonylcarbamoyl adenosine modification protein YeaZ